VKETLWLKKLFAAFGRHVSTRHMFCGNQATIKVIKHPIASMRSKPIAVPHQFVPEWLRGRWCLSSAALITWLLIA
jgi:hypothetical protein